MAEAWFERPFYVSRHAAMRFGQRVAPVSHRQAIAAIQAGLQVVRPVEVIRREGRIAYVVAEAAYHGRRYWAVVAPPPRPDAWPVVVTILPPRWPMVHGCTPPWARGHGRHLHRRRWRPAWTAAEWQRLVALRRHGLPWREIARRLGRSPGACRVAWCRFGRLLGERRGSDVLRVRHVG